MKASSSSPQFLVLNLLCLGVLLTFAFAPLEDGGESFRERRLRLHGRINLPVESILQMKYTSCGEAAITMAHNHAHPEDQVTERDVIEYAARAGYYTEDKHPFTSPANMLKIAGHFADEVSTGRVETADEALSLLTEKLTNGSPVIIDTLSRLDDPESGAHFVLITGLTVDPQNPNRTKIHFNDPLTGANRPAYWLDIEGVWNAWQNNGDPGGSGWWMTIERRQR